MAKIIAVWGPTGAPGRTTVAINVAAELAELGNRVLLIDADTYGGAIAPLLGLVDEASGLAAVCRLAEQGTLAHEDIQRLSQHVPTRSGQLHVLSGIVKTDRWPELSAERIKKVLGVARESSDVIVVDVGFNLETDEEITSDLFAPRRNGATLTVLKEADCIVAVSGSDALGIARFIRAHDQLVEEFPESLSVIVVNKVRTVFEAVGAASAAATLSRYAGLHDVHELVFDDKATGQSLITSAPLLSSAPKSKLRKQIQLLALKLSPVGKVTELKQNRFARSRKKESVSEQSEQHQDSA